MKEKDTKNQTCCENSEIQTTGNNVCGCEISSCCGESKKSKWKTIVFAIVILAAIGLGAYKIFNNKMCIDSTNCTPDCNTESCCEK